MRKLTLIPDGWPCDLSECPPGLFLFEDNVCFKTEYGAMETVGPVNVPGNEIRWTCGSRADAYNSAGEHFCVGTPESRERVMVQPLIAQWEEG